MRVRKITNLITWISMIFFFNFGCENNSESDLNGNETTSKDNKPDDKKDEAKKAKEYLLFVGNSGTGKSTLINSLIGKKVAEARISSSRITNVSTFYEHNGKYFIDTPGLQNTNTKFQEQAASEIEKALKKDGKYRIFFVITLQSGRVEAADIATINIIMDAIKDNNNRFNIIINKVSKKEKNKILGNPEEMAKIYVAINSGKYKTNSIMYIDNSRDIDDDKTEFIKIEPILADFIYNKSIAIDISKQKVSKVETNEYDIIKNKLDLEKSKLQAELKAVNEKNKKLFDEMKKLQEEFKKNQA
jgi:GTPase Era involved in 16S rRNA processing